ncbi:MAG TPA: hypothetical protein DDZ90_19860, partial [Planctomycetaceae bacterium]|nr:hypothetical protein [Planctomycetaceae bacterium]
MSIEFGQSVAQQLFTVSDEEFLQSVQWKSKPTGDLMKGAQSGELGRFCKGLASTLKSIGKQKRSGKLSAEMPWSTLWSVESVDETCRTSDLISLIGSARKLLARPKKKSKTAKRKETPELSWDEISRLLVGWIDQISASDPLQPFELLL